MFEEQTSYVVGEKTDIKKVLPWEITRREIMYPTRRDVVLVSELSCELAVAAVVISARSLETKVKQLQKI